MQLSCTLPNLLLYDELGIINDHKDSYYNNFFCESIFKERDGYCIDLDHVKFMIVKYKIVV